MPTAEDEVRSRVEQWAAAVRARDRAKVAAMYAPDVVSYDVGPAPVTLGVDAKMRNWAQVFALPGDLLYEIRDLAIEIGGDLAVVRSSNRVGADTPWVRFTACLRRIDGTWLIVHDHVSLPSDPPGG